jgi:hypothetical protein
VKKNYIVCTGIAVTAIVVIGGALAVLASLPTPLRPGVSKESFDRIHLGMKQEEVHALFEGSGCTCIGSVFGCTELWFSTDGAASAHISYIYTSKQECMVSEKSWTDSETRWQRLRRRLRL